MLLKKTTGVVVIVMVRQDWVKGHCRAKGQW
jgi:hypothetical protein